MCLELTWAIGLLGGVFEGVTSQHSADGLAGSKGLSTRHLEEGGPEAGLRDTPVPFHVVLDL